MSDLLYYILCGLLTVGILAGIYMMSKVALAGAGNRLSAVCMAAAVVVTLIKYQILSDWLLWISMVVGLVIGIIWSIRVKMIDMPQLVALYNGLGGAASALVAFLALYEEGLGIFSKVTAALALAVGLVTLAGSLVAAGKLHKLLPQKPVIWRGHQVITTVSLLLIIAIVIMSGLLSENILLLTVGGAVISSFFGVAFAVRVGGADMPITISLLNSLSGVAGSIAGMAIGDPLLVAVGGIVGASGLLLTQIMCRAMNRHLLDILLGKTSVSAHQAVAEGDQQECNLDDNQPPLAPEQQAAEPQPESQQQDYQTLLREAKKIIIVPGYGMALAQAQQLVKQLADRLEERGADIKFAIHPVAGRMPGHMNVLLCEADVSYDQLYEMEDINPEFDNCDVAIIIGANDVVNPAARDAEGTPIYGMPVLNVDRAKHVIICNYDLKPGYAGVPNPLYEKNTGVTLLLGDAVASLNSLLECLENT